MSSQYNEFLKFIRKDYEKKTGIICLNSLIMASTDEEIREFMHRNGIKIPAELKLMKVDYVKLIALHYYNIYLENKVLPDGYTDLLTYMGDLITQDEVFKKYLENFDFISRQDLIDRFSDFCADIGISVYRAEEIPHYSIDLYLIKRKPTIRTEAVFVFTGHELTEETYLKTRGIMLESSKIAYWTVFVTTPAGVHRLGLNRLIDDMERIGAWFYVIDPAHKRVLGILKGKKSKDKNDELRDGIIQKLPKEPIRTISQVIKISKYQYDEGESYKVKSFRKYEFFSEEEQQNMISMKMEPPKYRDVFKNLIILEQNTGLPLISYSNEETTTDQTLVSGFLTALDGFFSELTGTSTMKQIQYKGLEIHGISGDFVKMALFLSKPADQSLKERSKYFIKKFEEKYRKEIDEFIKHGIVKSIRNDEIVSMARQILDI